jgi:hypothetical protein
MSDFDDYTIIASRGWPILSDHGVAGETGFSIAELSEVPVGHEVAAGSGERFKQFRKIGPNRWSGEPTTENDQ